MVDGSEAEDDLICQEIPREIERQDTNEKDDNDDVNLFTVMEMFDVFSDLGE